MTKRFLTHFLLLALVFQCSVLNAYSNDYPKGYTDCVDKMDPQTETLLFKINQPAPAFRKIPIEELERMAKEDCSTATPHPDLEPIENISIKGPNGQLGLRMYKPKSDRLLPVFIYFHGGGWTAGSLNQYDFFCQEICEKAKCLLVSVDYGQAPHSTYPKPLEDCFFATKWIQQNIRNKGGDAAKIAIGGDSAGGNLTAAVALKARANQTPQFLCQILICPALNYNFDTLSYFEFAEGYFISREDMKFFWNNYLAQMQQTKDALISPLQADSLRGLPATLLIIANFDPLRDEGLAYGLRLHREGVPVRIKRYNSIHGFYGFYELDLSKEAINFISSYLSATFSQEIKDEKNIRLKQINNENLTNDRSKSRFPLSN